jgi:GNAT superfamily N-acetyltransferase
MIPLSQSQQPLRIEKVGVERILNLRHRILRAGLPFEMARFPDDLAPTSAHFAAFIGPQNAEPVACASFMLNSWEGKPAWQLRGMAIAAEHQGTGIGRALLAHAEQEVAANSCIRLFWCNARVPAVGFYVKQGWAVRSEEFDIPTAGPHCRMTKTCV